jgi:hypothetical protein
VVVGLLVALALILNWQADRKGSIEPVPSPKVESDRPANALPADGMAAIPTLAAQAKPAPMTPRPAPPKASTEEQQRFLNETHELALSYAVLVDLSKARHAARKEPEERAAISAREEARKEADGERIKALRRSLKKNPELGTLLLDALLAMDDQVVALRMTHLLRRAKSEALVARLQSMVRDAPRASDRRLALQGLEFRDYSAWGAVAEQAYSRDLDATVRNEAAKLFGQATADSKYRAQRQNIRGILERGLASPDAADRIRALRSFLYERIASPNRIAGVKAALKDEDQRVRTEAGRVLRVLGISQGN